MERNPTAGPKAAVIATATLMKTTAGLKSRIKISRFEWI